METQQRNGSNGNSKDWKLPLAGGGIASVILAFSINTSKDAQIALDVARQHG